MSPVRSSMHDSASESERDAEREQVPVSSHERAALLPRVQRVQDALEMVQQGRRALLSGGVMLAVLVIAQSVAILAGTTGRVPAAWVPPTWLAWTLALALGVISWWRLRPAAPDPVRTSLWVEECAAAARRSKPDFALTTAVEYLTAGTAVSPALAVAAIATLDAAPVSASLAIARRRTWRWPAVFVAGCVWLWLLPSPLRQDASDASRASVAGVHTPNGGAVTITPLGAWRVRLQPPAYTALPPQAFGDVASVMALAGSTVTVVGEGAVPAATLTPLGARNDARTAADSTRPAAVRTQAGGWMLPVRALSTAQALRVARGGRTRLLIIEGRADSVPRVALEAPARDSVFREPRGVLPLAATAHDDIGLARAQFELVITSGEGERFTVRTVLLGARQFATGTRTTTTALRGQLDLAALQLQPGDVVHLRAVARDGHPDAAREFGSSETRAFRVARPAEYDSVAVEPAPPPEVDKSLLSQRMLLLLTEKLDKAQRRLTRPEVLRESLRLARDQTRLRLAVGDVVFQRLSGESSAEHAHSAGDGHDHGVDLQGGKLSVSTSSTTGMLEEGNDSPVIAINQPLLEAYNAMWDAGRALEQGDPHGAIPPMKRALEAIERSRAASRLYLRGKPPQVIVDIAKVRLTGRDTGQVTGRSRREALPAPMAQRDARLVRAAVLLTTDQAAARDSIALLRVESLGDAPSFAAALGELLGTIDRGGDATGSLVQARRVLGTVSRVRSTSWSRGSTP